MRGSDPAGGEHPAPARPGHQMQLELGLRSAGEGSGVEGDRPGRRPYKQRLGAIGEERAAAWYLARGYTVVARNWRCRDGELDLVVRGGDTLVFCEVKTRASTRFGAPFEAVTAGKQRRLRNLALRWLAEHGTHRRTLRFDVASVTRTATDELAIEVLEGAF
jgi:putative endonuclease